MNRRDFLAGLAATAGGVLVPWEPRRVYSFASDVGRAWSFRGVPPWLNGLLRDLERQSNQVPIYILPEGFTVEVIGPDTRLLIKRKPAT